MYRIILNIKSAVVALVFAVGMAVSCSKEPVVEEWTVPEGMIPLEVAPVKMYGYGPRTKAAAENDDLKGIDPLLLRENNTLRLIVMKEPPAGNVVEADNLVEGDFVYIIKTDMFGNVYPQPCQVDDEGVLIPNTVTTKPYYLPVAESEEGKPYYCMAISPAKKLHNDGGIMKIAVKNQESILVSNNYWVETEFNNFIVSNKVTDKATAHLNPLIYGTALIKINVVNGANVTSLFPGQPFLGLDRVPTNPGEKWVGDRLDGNKQHTMPEFNLEIGGEIAPQMGNNILYNRLFVNDYKMSESYEGTAGTSDWSKNISILTETNILPMDARPTPMIIRINVYVNETPMQFQYQTMELFEPGHVYEYTATIKLAPNDMYVATWQDVSWSWTLSPVP